ncbi:MAG: alpha/beta hydrolase [Hyphomonadaceae bacterium]|nr:alpha/beta hydrolase [Hyphomonadaceae bacterium]MBC6413195.1 alpha/beta hydrolase [Hyphomonadaceae bacterium]
MPTEKIEFTGAFGDRLSAKLDWPDGGQIKSWVLFAHGFSIGKDLKPIRTVSRTLVANNYAMMRFDFTGLGESGGDFSDTNFSSNCVDLRNAADYLREHHKAPCVMIGHSFGGTAALKIADEIPECKAVATIGSPCDTTHIVHQFADKLEEIEEEGEAKVLLGGRPFVIKEQFLDDVGSHDITAKIESLGRALMIFHSPQDAVVGIKNAAHIYSKARHPKSFVSLNGADHLLLKNPMDAEYVAHVLAAWAQRYI